MANPLKINLNGKTVILKSDYWNGSEDERKFYCDSGSGCNPESGGNLIFGHFLDDGFVRTIRSVHVERLA